MNRSLSISRKEFVADALIILLCVSMLLALDSQRSYVFFRDYAITFEGAYRLFLGQLPYRDFGMPVGPVSLLIPSVFFRAFGADWEVFHVSQLFQNCVLLLLIWGVLHRLQVRPLTRRLSLLSYTLFSLSLLSHPWYNISGHMLMAGTLLLGLGTSWTSVIAAGLMAGLGILSKQDFGALGLLMCSAVIAHKALFPDAVPGADTPVYHTGNLGRAMLRVLLFWLLAAAVTGLCALVTDPVQFAYWFNLGQAPHQPRGLTLHDLLGNSFGTLGLLAAGIGLWKNNLPC